MKKRLVPPKGEAEREQQRQTRPAPQPHPWSWPEDHATSQPTLPPKKPPHSQDTPPPKPYILAGHLPEVTAGGVGTWDYSLSGLTAAQPLPPTAIPTARGSRHEHKLLFLSLSTSALTASIGVGFPKHRPKSSTPPQGAAWSCGRAVMPTLFPIWIKPQKATLVFNSPDITKQVK